LISPIPEANNIDLEPDSKIPPDVSPPASTIYPCIPENEMKMASHAHDRCLESPAI
jgi:hypothetical protein